MTKFYASVKNNLYPKLAEENAKAIHGMSPKIQIWGMDNGASSDRLLDPITNIMKSLPPMRPVLDQQMGIKLPDWMKESGSYPKPVTKANKNSV